MGGEYGKKVRELIYKDPDINTAYLLFKLKNWDPRKYVYMGRGAREVTSAFLRQEIQEIEEVQR